MSTKLEKLNKLSWGQKFALIAAFNMTDAEVISMMGLLPIEYKTAKNLLAKGSFQVDTLFDTSRYAEVIRPTVGSAIVVAKKEAKTSTKATAGGVTPMKRGRKGDKIDKAFRAITTTPVPADAFITQHDVSLPVIRQSKRFDKSGLGGTVHVKKHEGVLMIWRELPPGQSTTTVVPEVTVDTLEVPSSLTPIKATKPARLKKLAIAA